MNILYINDGDDSEWGDDDHDDESTRNFYT